jgi:hypothetical protein
MGVDRTVVMVAIVLACSGVAAAGVADGPPLPAATPAAEGVSKVPCTPVDTTWPMSSSGPYDLQPPRLSVVVTDLRPKDTVVLLDGRVAGRSRYFNGKKGFLYLEPGRYKLELRLDGYRPVAFDITARPNCRFDVRHRMERAQGLADAGYPEPPGKGEPAQWVWQPVQPAPATPAPAVPPGGPDLSLRPDLGPTSAEVAQPAAAAGSIKLRVEPSTASVYLDGSFLATARELGKMVAPLVVPAGQHVVEVRAAGFASRSVVINVVAGERVELEVALQREAS